jgi:hypothetical protein
MVLMLVPSMAQDFDPAVNAAGWTRADADGSFTCFDPVGKRLVTWLRDGNTLGHVDLAKLEGTPEAWVIDSYGNAWVVVGTNLWQVDKKGKLGNRAKLPAAVADLSWDPRGLVIVYRAAEPYVEKREYKSGSLVWSWGTRPSESSSRTLFRVSVTNNNEVVVVRGTSMSVDVLDLQSGKLLRQLALAYKGAAAPDLELGNSNRGPLTWSASKGVAFAAVPGTQAPHARMNGLLLARIDLAAQSLEFLPTGLSEDHTLVGIVENDAAFLKPKGGLVFVPVR